MKGKNSFVVLVTVLLGALPALAQVSDTDLLQQLRADIQADRQALVAANLGLTDDEGDAFWPVYREYRNDMSKVGDRLQNLIQDYADAYPNVTEDQAKAMVDEMIAIRHDELQVRKSHLSKFRKALPETKVARFLQIENKIDAIVNLGLADAIPLVETGG
jgi:UTP:GlnB (protein PII) uridylyltransferase